MPSYGIASARKRKPPDPGERTPAHGVQPAMTDHPVQNVVATLDRHGGHEKVAFAKLLDGFGEAAFPPCLLLPALMMVSPLSGIPLFSSFCALTIALIAAQGAWGRRRIWLPEFIAKREIAGEKLQKAAKSLQPVVRISAKITKPRLGFLTRSAVRRVIYGAVMLLAACVPVLELVPFASSLIGFVVAVIAIALLTRDGVVLLIGLALAGVIGFLIENIIEFAASLF
jgi:hypothetical protein